MPNDAELGAYYQRYDVLGEREPYYQAMWGADAIKTPEGRDIQARYFWAQKYCGHFGKTLDAGSGPGLFLRLVKEAGGVPVGAELNARAAERSGRELGIKVVAGTVNEVDEKDFDTITLWDLIEHVSDPAKLIVECRKRLKDGGWLFLETPDEGGLLDRAVLFLEKIGVRGPAMTFYGLHHLVLFRPKTVARLLRDGGFTVVEIAGAATTAGRIFRGNGFKDKMTRLGLGGLFLLARLINRQNKMLIAAKKINIKD